MFIQHVGVAKDSNKMRKLSLYSHVAGSLELESFSYNVYCMSWIDRGRKIIRTIISKWNLFSALADKAPCRNYVCFFNERSESYFDHDQLFLCFVFLDMSLKILYL